MGVHGAVESFVGGASGLVCVRWNGNAVASHGTRPHDAGLFPRVDNEVRRVAEAARHSTQ